MLSMSQAGRFKDLNDCMNQMALKYPDPNIRKAVCLRLTQESAGSGTASKPGFIPGKPKPK